MTTNIPRVGHIWTIQDYIGAIRVRLGIHRNRYQVSPGLYQTGNPGPESPVLVSANYKLSFDHLRRQLNNIDAWILVLDTRGVNVWCAAGKGTFGTEELAARIGKTGLSQIVSHRTLILPQLGAPGIDPAEVKKLSGFIVKYGPVEAAYLPEYLQNDQQVTKEMRRKHFSLSERLLVSLTHFVQGLGLTFLIAIIFSVMDFIFLPRQEIIPILSMIPCNIFLSLAALFCGSILFFLLLPVLPGRAFTVKASAIVLVFILVIEIAVPQYRSIYVFSKLLILGLWAIFQALNLTGSSTYTSLSGVQKEMSFAVPLLTGGFILGLVGMITGGIFL